MAEVRSQRSRGVCYPSFKAFPFLCKNASHYPYTFLETQFTRQPVSGTRQALGNRPEPMPETGSQRKCWFILKEEGVCESKVLRHQGGCEHSLERPRNAGSGTGFPVAPEWNAHYSYLDSKRDDPRRLENSPMKQGPSQDKETEPSRVKLPKVQRVTAAEPGSHLGLGARARQPPARGPSSYWDPPLPLGHASCPCPVSSKRPLGVHSLVVQWLRLHAPNAQGLGSISGQEIRSHRLPATTKTQSREINKNK